MSSSSAGVANSPGNPRPVPYAGNMLAPYPPLGDGWADVGPEDPIAAGVAAQLVGWLPLYHQVDGICNEGLYRFFCFESGWGRHVGAVKFVGHLGMMGQDSTSSSGSDPGTGGSGTEEGGSSSTTASGASSSPGTGYGTTPDQPTGEGTPTGGGGTPTPGPGPTPAPSTGSSSSGGMIAIVLGLAAAATVGWFALK